MPEIDQLSHMILISTEKKKNHTTQFQYSTDFDYHREKINKTLKNRIDKTNIEIKNKQKHNIFLLWSPKFTHKVEIYLQDQLGRLTHKVTRREFLLSLYQLSTTFQRH